MIDKLKQVEERFNRLTEQLSDPDVIGDMKKLREVSQERSSLEPVVKEFHKYLKYMSDLEGAKELIDSDDPEIKEMAEIEISELEPEIEKCLDAMKLLLVPKDPYDNKNVYLEIRAGTGGDEAGLFAGDLLKMYQKLAEKLKWKFSISSINESAPGVIKEIIIEVSGDEVYGKLKYESGVHRVQRVPATETQGRVHTSAASVAVLPQMEVEDVKINQADLRIDTYRASGAGGQHVNTTDSAIRITHLPTGVVVTCQNERSQHKNKDAALKMLASKLQEAEDARNKAANAENRKLQVGSGDRSAKIRTYNYPQGRVTDHRINLTLYKLDSIMNGDILEIIEGLQIEERAEKLKAESF